MTLTDVHRAELAALADALEAAEAQRAEDQQKIVSIATDFLNEQKARVAAEAQRDTLATAARAVVESHWFQIRSEGSAHALVQALAGVAPPEEQPK